MWDYAAVSYPQLPALLQSPELEDAYYATRLNLGTFQDVNDLPAVLDDAVGQGLLTEGERVRLQAWADIVAELPTEDLIQVTLQFEEEVLGAPDLTEGERSALLAGFATGRYSAVYWADQAADPQSPWQYCQQHAAK